MYERCTLAKTVDASFPAHVQGLTEEVCVVKCVHPAHFSDQACRSFVAVPVIKICRLKPKDIMNFIF